MPIVEVGGEQITIGPARPAIRVLNDAGTPLFVMNSAGVITALAGLSVATLSVTGPLLLGDGTVALPAYSFAADPDTGFFRAGSGRVSLSLNGVQAVDNLTTGTLFGSGTLNSLGNGGTQRTVEVHKSDGTAYLSLASGLTADTSLVGVVNFGSSGAATNKAAASIQVTLAGSGVTNASGAMRFYTRNGAAFNEVLSLIETGATTVTSAAASALAVGRLGATTPAFVVDASAGTSIVGAKVTAAAAGSRALITAVGETNAGLQILGSGTGGVLVEDADGRVGFYGAAPVALQTGVAVTAEAIHAALVNLGLITA